MTAAKISDELILDISDQRMLDLIDILKQTEEIRFTQEFCDAIGFRKQNIRNVRTGAQHFTAEHIRKACLTFNCNANWIFDLESDIARRKERKKRYQKRYQNL